MRSSSGFLDDPPQLEFNGATLHLADTATSSKTATATALVVSNNTTTTTATTTTNEPRVFVDLVDLCDNKANDSNVPNVSNLLADSTRRRRNTSPDSSGSLFFHFLTFDLYIKPTKTKLRFLFIKLILRLNCFDTYGQKVYSPLTARWPVDRRAITSAVAKICSSDASAIASESWSVRQSMDRC